MPKEKVSLTLHNLSRVRAEEILKAAISAGASDFSMEPEKKVGLERVH